MVLSSCPCPRGPDSSLRAQLLHQPDDCSTGWGRSRYEDSLHDRSGRRHRLRWEGIEDNDDDDDNDDNDDGDGLDVREEHGGRHPHASAGPEPVQR